MIFDGWVSEKRFYENKHGNNEDKINTILYKLIFYKMFVGFSEFIEDVSSRGYDEDGEW
jgi:hypothetical protein